MLIDKSLRLLILIAAGALAACARPSGQSQGSATVQIQMPSAEQLAASVHGRAAGSATAVDATLLCLAVNVKGDGIAKSPASTCQVEWDLATPSVLAGSGSTLTLNVPAGDNRTFEVYGFLLPSSSQKCPDVSKGWNGYPLGNIYFLGSQSGVSIQPPTANVSLAVSLPSDSTQNIISQANFSPSCSGSSGGVSSSAQVGRIGSGMHVGIGTTYHSYTRVSADNEDQTLTGSHFQIHGWRSSGSN